MSSNNILEFNKFEIHYLYGFRLSSNEKLSFDTNQPRNGWVSPYPRLFTKNKTFQINDFGKDEQFAEGFPYSLTCNNNHLHHAKKEYKFQLTKDLTIRSDGFSAFNLGLSLDKDKYTVSDIIRFLLLVPRTYVITDDYKLDRISPLSETHETFRNFCSISKDKPLDTISDPFIQFVNTVKKIADSKNAEWRELSANSRYALYEDIESDSQIPYFFVKAYMPWDKYLEFFIQPKSGVIESYSNEIAALLVRIYTDENIKYMSSDYWKRVNNTDEFIFPNRYVNSLAYVDYSNLVTLMIVPEISDSNDMKQKAIDGIESGILRALEFTKLKHHQCIWINKQLENLGYNSFEDYPLKTLIREFLSLEYNVSTLLDTPEQFMWDGTLGRQISSFLYKAQIQSLEEEISSKLHNIRNLINDIKFSFRLNLFENDSFGSTL